MHSTRLRFAASAVIVAASAVAQEGQSPKVEETGALKLDVVVTDTDVWRTHRPGSSFQVSVRVVGDASPTSAVTCQWVDENRKPLGEAIPVSDQAQVIQSPSTAPGFYGLVFQSTDPKVAFAPQPAGFPSAVYGFAVLPPPPSGTPMTDPTSPFGMVQANVKDPYLWCGSGPRVLGIHLKTKSWNQPAGAWASSIRERPLNGHTEMPLIHNDPWVSVDTQPIGTAQLDLIGAKFATLLKAEPKVEYWQAGREENGGDPYQQSHYFSNLLAKMKRLRAEADAISPAVKFAYSTRGTDMVEFEQLFASQAFGDYYDGLAHDVYKWPDFPTPEGWLPAHIADISTLMNKAGRAKHFFWFGECGIPVRGTNDPNAFFGYPAKQSRVPGCSLDYAATYLVKFHALAIANGIKRLYWYNYKNRGNDIDYAEHHFGLRSYSAESSDPGHPLPAYVAYITMLAHLKGCSFVGLRHPTPNVFAFEFAVEGATQRRILAWVNPAQSVTLALTELQSGLVASKVETVSDIYGRPVAAISSEKITLDGRPLFLRY